MILYLEEACSLYKVQKYEKHSKNLFTGQRNSLKTLDHMVESCDQNK